ncbi:hypothetical protein [Leptolyngbya sp. ST-U4]|uniref:hypothetical protein n=1 Tax=Leptolyngbya sp. ST-U4 TaxID=2933912 RepID=UPI0032999C43
MTTTDFVPQNGTLTQTQTHNPLLRQRVVFDGGNRTTAWINPKNKIQIIPSIIKNLEDWELDSDAQSDEKSALISHEGSRYVVGQMAHFLNGSPIFQKNKTEMALFLVLAALEPNPGERVVTVNELLIALPDSCSELQTSRDQTANKAMRETTFIANQGVCKPQSLQMKLQT